MQQRGYTLLDFDVPAALWPDRDRVVRFLEYVRVHIKQLVPGIPPECTIDLMASGTTHNEGKVPLLGLHCPEAMTIESIPDAFQIIASLGAWAAALSQNEVERIVSETNAPTWEELCGRSN